MYIWLLPTCTLTYGVGEHIVYILCRSGRKDILECSYNVYFSSSLNTCIYSILDIIINK